jgi:hypothetical protein
MPATSEANALLSARGLSGEPSGCAQTSVSLSCRTPNANSISAWRRRGCLRASTVRVGVPITIASAPSCSDQRRFGNILFCKKLLKIK